ncbi:MAG: bifunctional enoyl-CoA hydratase/phosphate acetyltransferase [Burkholderiaceae bacterium]|nr:bifunctional enoyl-CoA hydratase/phosphate acetyltransferase [Burkholderiaceae bacterium]
MSSVLTHEILENKTFDEIALGDSARLVRTLTKTDVEGFAAVSGDTNPTHLDSAYAAGNSPVNEIVGHSMWSASLISSVLANSLPGIGTVYLDQKLHFKLPVKIGDTVTVTIKAISKNNADKSITFDCLVQNQRQETIATGEATVLPPKTKMRREKINAPQIQLFDPDARLKALLALGAHLDPILCGIVHPCEPGALQGAIEAAEQRLIQPVLIGPKSKILATAEEAGLDVQHFDIIDTPHSHASAEIAAQMAAEGKLEALMKGSLHTDELMGAVVSNHKLRTKRRISHIWRFEVPLYSKPLLITDAAINIAPTLTEKVDIIQNAITLAHVLGNPLPKVAILSAVETVNPNISSTLDAAALCKMADRKQITGGVLDGPLAFDNAISMEAAQIKHIESPVAGQADILVAPDLESANMIGKQLEYLAGATSSGIVMGARIPLALTSRADGPMSRMSSALLAKLLAHHYRANKP